MKTTSEFKEVLDKYGNKIVDKETTLKEDIAKLKVLTELMVAITDSNTVGSEPSDDSDSERD